MPIPEFSSSFGLEYRKPRLSVARPQIQQSAGGANLKRRQLYIPVCRKAVSFSAFIQRLLSAPASGYRNRTTGALTNVGTNGDYWSSSPAAAGNANGGAMAFNSGVVYPWHSEGRAIGFTVRCVQHLRAAFIEVNENIPHGVRDVSGTSETSVRNGT